MAGFANEDENYEMEDILESSNPYPYTILPQLLATDSQSQWQPFPPERSAPSGFNNLSDITAFADSSETNPFDTPNAALIQPCSGVTHLPSFLDEHPMTVRGLADSAINAMHSENQNFQPGGDTNTLRMRNSSKAPKARKVPTIKAEVWKPYEAAVREHYVQRGCKLKEICSMLMKEFNFVATERQVLKLINDKKWEKNVKLSERTAVIRHVNYRNRVEKKRSHPRIRGHRITPQTITRWVKEAADEQWLGDTRTPSPLPSCISLYTNSICGSPKATASEPFQFQPTDILERALRSILNYAQDKRIQLEAQDSRLILNDLQTILTCLNSPDTSRLGRQWCTCGAEDRIIEEQVTRTRNIINICDEMYLIREWEDQKQTSVITNMHPYQSVSWMTRFGRVDAVFGTDSNTARLSDRIASEQDTNDDSFATKIAITPIRQTSSFRILFDLNRTLDPRPKITYQRVIPNDSEIFHIIAHGTLQELVNILDWRDKTVPRRFLSDRDEAGRPLLSHAAHNLRPDMCKFLLDNGASENEICAFMLDDTMQSTILYCCVNLHSELTADKLQRSTDCFKALLEAGADVTTEYLNGELFHDDFSHICNYSLVNYSSEKLLHADYLQAAFKHILDLGPPFISTASPCKDLSTGRLSPALSVLAGECGLVFGSSFNILDKAILLLNRGADISCRDYSGDTVLHSVISSMRLHEFVKVESARSFVSRTQPFNLLVAFITSGADVYAANNAGETPSMVAMKYGRMDEWASALGWCGFDVDEVLDHPSPCCKHCVTNHQTAQLSFKTWCEQLGGHDHDSWLLLNGCWDGGEIKHFSDDEITDEWDETSDEGSNEGSDEGSDKENTGNSDVESHLHLHNIQCIATGNSDEPTDQLLEDSQYRAN